MSYLKLIYEEIFMLQYYVYILSSAKYGTLYTGITGDLITRVYQRRTNQEVVREHPHWLDLYEGLIG